MAKLTYFFLLKYANYARIFILIIEKNFDPKIRINPWTDPGLKYYMPFRIEENYMPIRVLDRHPGCGYVGSIRKHYLCKKAANKL